MKFAVFFVLCFSDDLAVFNDDTANQRIGMDEASALPGKLDCPPHVLDVFFAI